MLKLTSCFLALLAVTSAAFPGLPALPASPGLPALPSLPQLPVSSYVITLQSQTDQLLATLAATPFASRADRLNAVAAALKSQAALSQGPLLAFLASTPIAPYIKGIKSLWITNEVFITGQIPATILDLIQQYLGVSVINPEKYLPLPISGLSPAQSPDTWGIVKIQAQEAAAIYNGTGIRVGSIDTGVRSTHVEIKDNFIGNQYGWFDPYYGSLVPSDTVGHGTHTMGTMVGKTVGVAPGAKWMTCKGCDGANCALTALKLCTQFMLCPTKQDGTGADCSQAPHIINNSWGAGHGDTSFDSIINAWHAAGIIPIFAAGDSGPTCGSVVSPADSVADVIAVGSTTSVDSMDPTSSLGPSVQGNVKPDIVAPGFLIRSAYNTSDTGYGTGIGTSFASPHVSGTAAILLSANSSLSYSDIKQQLIAGVDTAMLINNPIVNCDGGVGTKIPNNQFGSGRLNALNSLNKLLGRS